MKGTQAMIEIENLSKSFTLHNQGGAVIPVMAGAHLHVGPGDCVALTGSSGAGKSTLMRMIYGNYRANAGRILVGETDVARAAPREIIQLRRHTLGYVSQFLRVVPRVPTRDVVAEPLLILGTPRRGAACAPQHPRTALVAQPHDLFGRRATARQHRARLCP